MSSETPPPVAAGIAAITAAILAPINTFLTALQQPGVNLLTVQQDLGTLDLGELAALPNIESDAIVAAAAEVQAQLAAATAAITPPATPPTA